MGDGEYQARINEKKLGGMYDLDDVIDGMTIWESIRENGQTVGEMTHKRAGRIEPLLMDENGSILSRAEANEAVKNGKGIFVIENNPEDEVVMTAFVQKDPASGEICASNSIPAKRANVNEMLRDVSAMKKPGFFKRIIHSMFSGAFKEVGEYDRKQVERQKFLKSFGDNLKAVKDKGLAPVVSVRSVSDSRAYIENKRERTASKFKANETEREAGYSFALNASEEAGFMRMSPSAQGKWIKEHGEGYQTATEDGHLKIDINKAYPALKGHEAILEGEGGKHLRRLLENGNHARNVIYSGIGGMGGVRGGDRQLAAVFIGMYIERLAARADTDPEAKRKLEWLSNPQNSGLLERNLSVRFPRSTPGTICFKEMDFENNLTKNLAITDKLCGDAMNGIQDDKAMQEYFGRYPASSLKYQYEGYEPSKWGQEQSVWVQPPANEPTNEQVTASIKAKVKDEELSKAAVEAQTRTGSMETPGAKSRNSETSKPGASLKPTGNRKPLKSTQVPRDKTAVKVGAKRAAKRKNKIKAVKVGTTAQKKPDGIAK